MSSRRKTAARKRPAAPAANAATPTLPPTRRMWVVAQDPSVRRDGTILMAQVDVPAEELVGGPTGYRVQVVDFDATARRFHGAHDLPRNHDDAPRAWREGNDSLVKDYRFHAQNVYALVMKTLARFEFALGRKLGWSFQSHQLKVAPHGMLDANAFYSASDEGLVFGYFEGSSGKPVYTCLSHDIVVHETTHALLDCLRERFMFPSGPDQAAFHEGFADVIALLSVFSLPEVVRHLLQPRRSRDRAATIRADAVTADALCQSTLFGLAEEMGSEMEGVRGAPLRQSASLPPDPNILEQREFLEPHRRGEVFVAAVLNAFISAWASRIARRGVKGQKSFPLASVVEEGADIADTLATMWIRAIDYMPPVHLEFGDALSAALTADAEVRPDDSRYELRHHLTQHFAAYGIEPASGEASGAWSAPPEKLNFDRVHFDSMRSDKDEVFRFLWDNRDKLELREGAYTQVISVRPSIRTSPDGFVLRETVSEYYQVARLTPAELAQNGIRAPKEFVNGLRASAAATEGADDADGDVPDRNVIPIYGGGVLIFDEFGRLKHWVHKDVFGARQTERLAYLWKEGFLRVDRGQAKYRPARFSEMHLRRALDLYSQHSEEW